MDSPPVRRTSGPIGYEPDGRIGNVLVEVKEQAHSFRNVRASMLALAYHLAHHAKARAILVLADSRITSARLERELALARKTLQKSIFERLSIVLEKDGHYAGLPKEFGPEFAAKLDKIVDKESPSKRSRSTPYVILTLLLHQWLLGKGPMTTDWLMKTAGASYPAVAAALKRYENVLVRHSNRKLQLRGFPTEAWAELVAVSARLRSTLRFADRSGQPRSPDALLRRLATRKSVNVAIGGINAARHYLPGIDLGGSPRLDLAFHAPVKFNADFVKDLDPALEQVGANEPATVVVHRIERKEPLFVPGKAGLRYVDPVECMLDLHDARLEAQAEELLAFFMSKNARQSK